MKHGGKSQSLWIEATQNKTKKAAFKVITSLKHERSEDILPSKDTLTWEEMTPSTYPKKTISSSKDATKLEADTPSKKNSPLRDMCQGTSRLKWSYMLVPLFDNNF